MSNKQMTPEQIQQGLDRLRDRVGYEMAQDDPMRSAAAEVEMSLNRIFEEADRKAIEQESKEPPAPSESTSPSSLDKA